MCKYPKCPSTDEWIKEMWYAYISNEILLDHKKMPLAATGMDLEIIITEVDHTEKDK